MHACTFGDCRKITLDVVVHLLILSISPPVIRWRHSIFLKKGSRKVRRIMESCIFRYFNKLDKNKDSKDFMYSMNRCYSLYPEQVNCVLFNFLDSHDIGRAFTRCGDLDVFFQQLVVLMTMPGSPLPILWNGNCDAG